MWWALGQWPIWPTGKSGAVINDGLGPSTMTEQWWSVTLEIINDGVGPSTIHD